MRWAFVLFVISLIASVPVFEPVTPESAAVAKAVCLLAGFLCVKIAVAGLMASRCHSQCFEECPDTLPRKQTSWVH